MLWLERLEALAPGTWDGEPVIWISQGSGQARGGVVRKLAARVAGMGQDPWQLEWLASGRPCLSGPRPLWVSSASRGEWHAVAIAREPIGVDIEARPAATPVPFNLLHPGERDCLAALADAAREQTFLCFWTAREAYWKSQGRGLDAPLSHSRAAISSEGLVEIHVRGCLTAIAETVVTADYVASAVRDGAYWSAAVKPPPSAL